MNTEVEMNACACGLDIGGADEGMPGAADSPPCVKCRAVLTARNKPGPLASVPRETRGQNGYKVHRQLVPRLAQSWWWLVLDASGETIALCDSQENADMIVLALSRVLSSRIIMP